MDPGGFGSKLLTECIAFSGLTAVFILLVAYIGYSADVMGAHWKRFLVGVVFLLFILSVGVTTSILYPDLPKDMYYFLLRAGYR